MLKRKASRTKFFLETPDSLRRKFAKNQGDQATHSGSSSLTVPVANAMPQSANEQPSNPAFQQLPAQLPPNPNPITYFPSFQSLLAADLSPSFLQFLAQEPIMQAYSETINTSLPAVTPNQTTNLINYPNGHVYQMMGQIFFKLQILVFHRIIAINIFLRSKHSNLT